MRLQNNSHTNIWKPDSAGMSKKKIMLFIIIRLTISKYEKLGDDWWYQPIILRLFFTIMT